MKSDLPDDLSYLNDIIETIHKNGHLEKFFDVLEGRKLEECLRIPCDSKHRVKVSNKLIHES